MSKYSNQAETKVAEEINSQFRFAKKYLDTIHQRMNSQEELYRTYIDPNNYPHGAKVFDPRIFRVIETITPRMVANEPSGSFYPTEQGDVTTAQILNALIKYDWKRADMFPKLVNFVKSMLIFGTAFGRNYWDFREKDKTRMIAKKINGRMVWSPKNTEKIKVTEFDSPNFEVLNIYDCFPDPNSTSVDNMRWFIYRTFKTLEELELENETRGSEYYKNLDKLRSDVEDKKAKKNGGRIGSDMQYREHRRIMLSTEELKGQDESNPEFVVLRRFTRDGWCDYVPEYNLVIREIENPYFHGELPIVYGVDYPYPGELYGMGEIEPVDRIQRAINAVLNQRLDNVQMTLNTMWKVDKNSGTDIHTLVSAPGNIITTNDMNGVEAVQVPDVTGTTFVQTMNYLTSSLQNGTGVTDYTVGIGGNNNVANSTATGTRLVQQEANAQFKLKIQLFTKMVIEKIANQWKDLRIQYTTDTQKLRIMGAEDVNYLKDKTQLAKTDLEGNPIIPGELDVKSKLQLSEDGNFAFLTLLPDDIQPSIVGNYDFVATVAYDQLSDPVALTENYFAALDRVANPAWVQGLQGQGKQLNYEYLTKKVFEKLQLGIEMNDALVDAKDQQQQQGQQDQAQQAPDIESMLGVDYQSQIPGMENIAQQYGGQQGEPTNPELQGQGMQ